MGKYYRKQVGILLLCVSSFSMFGQQDAQYTQYMYNTVSINPAYAGSRDVLSIVGLHRNQWVGIDGAPRTSNLTLHTPLGYSRRLGLGGSVISDAIGPVDEKYISVDFSYTIPTSLRGKLSFGLKGTAQLINVNFNQLNTFNPGDPEYARDIDNTFNPNVGVGLFYHTKETYAGLSVPNLLETEHFDRNSAASNQVSSVRSKEKINAYFIAGHIFNLSSAVKLKPAILTKFVLGAPLQVDLSANFLIHERLTLGAAYRWSAAISALAGFQISDSLMIGFAYDRETTDLQQFNNGSYELMLRFELFQKLTSVVTPRFF